MLRGARKKEAPGLARGRAGRRWGTPSVGGRTGSQAEAHPGKKQRRDMWGSAGLTVRKW